MRKKAIRSLLVTVVALIAIMTGAAFPTLALDPPITLPSPTPTAPPAGLPVSLEDSIPVVITYGDGTEAHVQITRGLMQPVGVPPGQAVTVTLFLANAIPGTVVHVGLYDGGQVAPVNLPTTPTPPPVGGQPIVGPSLGPIAVLADQSVRFNFQSGGLLGLYRVLLTIGPKQYLIQFFAVKPRPVTGGPPSPSPTAPVDISTGPSPSPTTVPIAPVVPTPPP